MATAGESRRLNASSVDPSGGTSTSVLGSVLAAAIATLSGLAGSTLLGWDGARRALGRATIAVSGLALVLALLLIWARDADTDPVLRAFGVAVIATLACVHASLLFNLLQELDARVVKVLTNMAVALASTVAVSVSGVMLVAHGSGSSEAWRVLGVLLVFAVVATLLAPLVRRIRASRTSSVGGGRQRCAGLPSAGGS